MCFTQARSKAYVPADADGGMRLCVLLPVVQARAEGVRKWVTLGRAHEHKAVTLLHVLRVCVCVCEGGQW
jgi:hypothetical protein